MNKNALTVAVLVCFVISSVTAVNYDDMDPRLMRLLQSVNSTETMYRDTHAAITNSVYFLQQMCQKNNQSALKTVMNQFSTMQNDIIKKLVDIVHDFRSKDPSVVIKNNCKQSRELKNILEYNANFVKLCLNETETKKVENVLNFIEKLVPTFCLDDAKFLISAYSEFNNFKKCTSGKTKGDFFFKCFEYKSANDDFEKDQCKFMEQLNLCIVKAMNNNCEYLKFVDIFVSAYDKFSRPTFCSQYSTSSSHKIGSNIFAATALSMIIVTYFNKFLII